MDKIEKRITASGLVLAAGFISVPLSGHAEMPQPIVYVGPPINTVNISPSGGTSSGFTWAHDLPEGVTLRFIGDDPAKGPEPLRLVQGGLSSTSVNRENPDPAGHPWYGGSDADDG